MTNFVLSLLFFALAVATVIAQKTYFYLPRHELKRQAARRDPLATVLWRAVAYDTSLRILLWVVIVVSTAIGVVLLGNIVPAVVAVVATAFILLYAFAWLPNTKLTSLGGRLTVWITPGVVWVLAKTEFVLAWLQRMLRRFVVTKHTGLFEAEDLIKLLEHQKAQTDNRIYEEDLAMAVASLQFSDRLVRDVLTPRRVVRAVSQDENVGPVLMDDLHKSGFSRFPVYGGNKDNIVGVLYLRDLVRKSATGRISTYMHEQVCYIHEEQTLPQALHAILKTHQQLLIVVNSFEEYVGIITIEDILEELIGKQIVDEFDKYEDLRAVAAHMASKDHQEHSKSQANTVKKAESQTTDPKVEPDTKK